MLRIFWATISLLVCLTPLTLGQPTSPGAYQDDRTFPGGVVGERIQALIETINSGSAESIRRFIDEDCTEEFRNAVPMQEHVDIFLEFHRTTRGVDFYSIRTYDPPRPDRTVVIVKDRLLGSWRGFLVALDDTPERRVAGLQFAPARPPSDLPPEAPLSEKQLVEEIQRSVEKLCESEVFSGTVLVAKGDKILFTEACGEASKRYHVPNNVETKFNLGSMNKMFTATAIVQLVERGEISYDDALSEYVDETWLPREITGKIKIRHLLTHTSGLGSYFNETYMQGSRERFRDVDDFKPLVRGDTLSFEPGTQYQYSNPGMLLLGVVIESVTGKSYFDHIHANIYEPAGMTNSDSYEMDLPVENLAIGYSRAPETPYGWRNNLFQHVIKGGPAGGGFSTVADLHRFARALQDGKLVSAASLELMWTDQSGEGYGYGFGVETTPKGKIVGHSGGFAGINGKLDIYVDTGYIVAVLSNLSMGAMPVAERVQQLLARVE